ncbi:tudor domain-containing protein 7B [Musca vetustissima]|uniref:tudor domain-containing protein 7B n=1 Tax=Musca vetustissima TaxID=27455 RepID=UPI002AB5FB26|nr:tudor domain-containing protein 7B [Musca vetustissima]
MSNATTPTAKQQELKHIASIVRALITSTKPPCYLKDILREYNEVESKQLPYKSLGYKTAQELLEDTGEFLFNGNRGSGDTIITAKFNSKTAHIASMVRAQKPSKSTRIAPVKAMKQPPRMPAHRSNGFTAAGGDRNNNSNNNYNNRNSSSSNQSHQQLQRQKSQGASNNSNSNNSSQPMDLRDMLNSKKNIRIQTQQSSSNEQNKSQQKNSQNDKQSPQGATGGPRPILGASKPSGQTENKKNLSSSSSSSSSTNNPAQSQKPTGGKPQTTAPGQQVGQKPQQRLNVVNQNIQQQQPQVQAAAPKPQKPPTQQPNTPIYMPTNNLAARLQQQQQQQALIHQQHQQQQQFKAHAPVPQVLNQGDAAMAKPAAMGGGLQHRLKVFNPQATSFSNQHKQPPFATQKVDAITALVQFCRSKNLPAPRFNCIKGKFSRGTFTCRVEVKDTIYSTYPHEYETEYLAKEACAIRALEKLKMQEKKRPMPPCTFSSTELLDKLYTELLNHPHGIFAKNLPEWFETTFQQSLPEDWWMLIQTSSLFTTETGLSKVIIFANKDADKDKTKVIQIDPICLPWSDEYWSIFITHCNSTVEVWGRLFGPDYSGRYSALMNDIEVYMANKKERPVSITRKNIYLVSINDSWHRIRVEELDKSKASCLCFFIDFGDADWLPVDQLFICETHFLKLPAQAVPFSLYGLEDFEGNPAGRKCLDDLLPTKSVVGKVFTKESEFYDTNSKCNGKIQVVLFDTSTQEDINLNHQLSNMICKETLPPEIKQNTVTNTFVSHVSDTGDIFVQVKSPELKYVQTLLQQIIETRFNRDQHKVTFDDLKRSNMFLICDDDDANDVKWYRGSVVDVKNIKADSSNYLMYYVDQGITKSVDMSKIFLLESLSLALSKFPEQAVKVRLHNIPEISKNIVGRIRGLLPKDCEVLTKMVIPGPVPQVTIHTRLEGPGVLVTINDVLRNEHELMGADLLPGSNSAGSEDDGSVTKFNLDFSKSNQDNSSSTSLASPTTPTSNSFIDITRGLTLTTVPGSPQKVSDLPKLNDYTNIPAIGELFDVRVTMSANPSNFIIQPYKDYPNLRTLMKELQTFCENSDEFIPTDMVEIGQAYAAKNADSFFHRVTAVKKYGDMIHVRFCDFGDSATVDSSQLKILPLKFRQLPKMAIQAKLYGIKAVNGDWTLDDCLFFRKLTVGQTFVSVIKNIKYDNDTIPATQILELELIDVSTDEDVLVHELLLNEKRAIKEN